MRVNRHLLIIKILFILSLISISIIQIQSQPNLTNDLSKVKVDYLTDEQVQQFIEKAQSSGLTMEQLESQALSRGMPSSEVEKLRDRISQLSVDKETKNKSSDLRTARKWKAKTKKEKEISKFDIFNVLKTPKQNEQDSLLKKIFGYDLFNNENLTFEPSFNIPTPQNYQLGAGDELIIDIWGASQATYRQTVSPEGSILIPNIGPIFVNGLTIEKASQRVIARLSSIYAGLTGIRPNTFAQISLGSIRSINIMIVGEVCTPGSYTLPSLATVFNALYASGGPSINGSLRNIKVFRDNKVVANLDVYNFLIKGDQKDNIRLQDQDIIMVSPFKIRIEVKGEIKRPAFYEMTDKETVDDLIRFAGGYTGKAYTYRSKLIRNSFKEYKILDVSKDSLMNLNLQNGDLLTIEPILNRFENRVQIAGAIFRPGQYELTSGLTLKGLISKAEGLKGDAFITRAIIFRTMENYNIESIPVNLSSLINGVANDITMQKDDSVKVFSIFDLQEEYKVKVDGEVINPDEYPYIVNSTLEDMIATAGGFKESASLAKIEIARRVKNIYADTSSSQIAQIYSFNVTKNLTISDSALKFILQPFDIISVRRSPGYQVQAMVAIQGEVNFAGNYSLSSKNERISDLIDRAGGLTRDAYIKGTRLIRALPEDEKTRQNLLKMIKTRARDSLLTETVTSQYQAIGINLEKILSNPHSKYDITLQKGDSLIIPKELQTVRLTGALLYPITARYDKKYGFRKYIALAGGFSEIASPNRSYVIYANGTVDRTRHFLFFSSYPKIEPGAEIIVPKKPENKTKMTSQESIAIATALATLGSMIISSIYLIHTLR